MPLKCGIVGLPNVGKSTLFNALTASQMAVVANYPFCTIEPNTALTAVPDYRLERLAIIAGSSKIIPAYMEFVDIAGLVKGASKGEGLGNKFLSHIREIDAILHVLRCFEDHDVTHVYDNINPLHDAEIIETELILADLESVERRLTTVQKRLKSGDKSLGADLAVLQDAYNILSAGKPIRDLTNTYDKNTINQLQLLTSKPILYICNVLEHEASTGNAFTINIANKAKQEHAECIIISSKIEAEISTLSDAQEKQEFLHSIGLTETGLSKIIKTSYNLLNLQSFFTVGPKEAHAWTFELGDPAPKAAGSIHTDFEKGFIRAEVIPYHDYISCDGEVRAKETGKMRLEGKEYRMQDGDVVHFRFNT